MGKTRDLFKKIRDTKGTFWRRKWQPTPVLLPGKSHGQRSLVGCGPCGHEESDMTEQLHFHFSLSCIGEGNGNPLQCSCLENPMDGGAWWAAVYGVAQSRTRLKRLSSSSSSGNISGCQNGQAKYYWLQWKEARTAANKQPTRQSSPSSKDFHSSPKCRWC